MNFSGPVSSMNELSAFVQATQAAIIPVALRRDGERWRKQPLVGWDRASTNIDVLEDWWQQWPNALPGIPLRYTNLVVVDADRREGVSGTALMPGMVGH